MKKNYFLIAIFFSFFSFNSSAINFKINTFSIVSNAGPSKLINNPKTILADPISNPTASSSTLCEGETLTLTANPSGGIAPYTYSWTGPNGYVSTDENPVINNISPSAAGVYSLIVTDALNAVSAIQSTAAVIVNTKIDPEFDATLPAICKGGFAPILSTTSTNGITGTWNPAIVNNTTTTTYIFTPDSGQCANSLTFTIFVLNNVDPKFTLPSSICSGDTPPILPNVSNNGIVGIWNPTIVSNTTSGSYVFTPSAGQCATVTTVNIAINPLVPVFIPAIQTICSGESTSPLPTTSTNGITGTWSPAFNNTSTSTYTFTPNAGQCAPTTATATMTVIINPITAVFTQVAPICSGQTLAPLPTTSDNGVTGTWSPTINNTATTTYTFTPTVGQCTVTPATMTIVVNPIEAVFTQIAPICSGQTLAPLPTTSDNGVTGTWSPAMNNLATTTYTFTPTVGQCTVTPVTMTLVVNPIEAVFTQVAPICSGQTLAALPTTSDNGVTGTWSPAMNNLATTTYTFTPTVGQCTITPVTMTIVVNPIEAVFTQVAPICSGQTLTPLPTTSDNGVSGTWSPAMNNLATTTYAFAPTLGQCTVTPVTMTIAVNPIEAVFTQVAPICSGQTLAALPTTSDNGVTGTWSPTINNTATTTYTFTPTVGQCTVTPVTMTIVVNPIEAVFTQVAPICSGQTLAPLPTTSDNGVSGTWSPAMNNLATTTYTFAPTLGQCTVTPVTMTIVVNPIVLPTFTAIAPFCSGSVSPVLPTTSNNSITGTWNPTTVSNINSATYTFTPTEGQCATTTTLDIIIIQKTIPLFDPIADVCYDSTAPILPLTSTNGITGTWNPPTVSNTVSAIYTFTPTDGICATTTTLTININAITPLFDTVTPICANETAPILPSTSTNGITGNWNPAIVSNTVSANYVFTPNAGQCATTSTLSVTINQIVTPTFTAIAPICSGSVSPVLPLTSNNAITGTWNPATISNTLSGTYTFTPTAGQCATFTTLDVIVNPNITPLFTPIAPICSGEVSPVLPLTSTNGVTGTWNPATVSNTLSGNYIFTPNSGQCAPAATLSVVVNPSPTSIALKTTDVINERPDGIIEITDVTSGLAPFNYSINNSSFTPNTIYSNLNPGNYTVTVQDSNGCVFSKEVTVNSICLIPNVISPNNDTFNDTFDLTGCDVEKLQIYNRYGVEVNDFRNYSDQWSGNNRKGESLPDGTYFYVAEIKNGTSKSGWVFITR